MLKVKSQYNILQQSKLHSLLAIIISSLVEFFYSSCHLLIILSKIISLQIQNQKRNSKNARRKKKAIVNDNDTSTWKHNSTVRGNKDSLVYRLIWPPFHYEISHAKSFIAIQSFSFTFCKTKTFQWQTVGIPTPSSADCPWWPAIRCRCSSADCVQKSRKAQTLYRNWWWDEWKKLKDHILRHQWVNH